MTAGAAGLWRLDGRASTLLLLSRDGGVPEIVHWGARLPPLTEAEVRAMRDRAVLPSALDEDVPFATLLPTLGGGVFGYPALAGRRVASATDWCHAFAFESASQDGDTLHFRLHDPVAALAVDYRLTLGGDVLVTQVVLENGGTTGFALDWLAAGAFLSPARATTVTTLGGRWGGEFQPRSTVLPHGHLAIENRRGRTSHDRFPLLIAHDGTEAGECWALHAATSGNHRSVAERLRDGSLLLMAGPLWQPGEMIVPPGGVTEAVRAVAAYSDQGAAGLARSLHAHVRADVLRWPGGAMTPRPVTLNTWEANYFEHDEARLRAQAEAAARLGIERFVLDDGWMRGRRHASAGLGDWTPDPERYPRGLGPLAQHVNALGMQFGLWVEPEMANPDSDAMRQHPDDVLHLAGHPRRTARGQLVLDLTREVVRARVRAALQALLDTVPIAYLKWDMNRDLGVAAGEDGAAGYARQTHAACALIDDLRRDNPALEIESCASGGARADYEMLARTHRVWVSDCTDALDRLSIQRGALRFLPPEVMGAHVSASPNHETGRRHTMAFRCAVALFFHFGVELDPLALTAEDAAELAAWIALHKRLRPLLHAGEHVAGPIEDGRSLLGVVATDRAEAAYLAAQETSPLHPIPPPLRLPGLAPDAHYRVSAPAPQTPRARVSATHRALFEGGVVQPGAALAAGFVPPALAPESALVLHAIREGG